MYEIIQDIRERWIATCEIVKRERYLTEML